MLCDGELADRIRKFIALTMALYSEGLRKSQTEHAHDGLRIHDRRITFDIHIEITPHCRTDELFYILGVIQTNPYLAHMASSFLTVKTAS